jgi:hypothetical protein
MQRALERDIFADCGGGAPVDAGVALGPRGGGVLRSLPWWRTWRRS